MTEEMSPPWRVLKLIVPQMVSDPLQGVLLDLGAVGLQIIDDETRAVPDTPAPPMHTAELLATFSNALGLEAGVIKRLSEVFAKIPGCEEIEVSWHDLFHEDWVAEFKSHWQPLTIGQNVHIIPSWHERAFSPPTDEDLCIFLDPGMAFGTGLHATTALCVQALQGHLKQKPIRRLLDVGTGTGILSIVALKLGAQSALGTDIDPVSVHNALANAAKNEVFGNFASNQKPPDQKGPIHDVVIANILFKPLLSLAEAITKAMTPGGTLFLSGLLENQADQIQQAYEAEGLTFIKTQVQDEWILMQFQKGD